MVQITHKYLQPKGRNQALREGKRQKAKGKRQKDDRESVERIGRSHHPPLPIYSSGSALLPFACGEPGGCQNREASTTIERERSSNYQDDRNALSRSRKD